MSMNIIYRIQLGKKIVYEDFEFQTPSDLTEKILEKTTKKEQLEIIYEYMKKTFDDDLEYMETIYSYIVGNLNDELTTLDEI